MVLEHRALAEQIPIDCSWDRVPAGTVGTQISELYKQNEGGVAGKIIPVVLLHHYTVIIQIN